MRNIEDRAIWRSLREAYVQTLDRVIMMMNYTSIWVRSKSNTLRATIDLVTKIKLNFDKKNIFDFIYI